MDNTTYKDSTMVFGISPKTFDFLSLATFDSKEVALNARFKVQHRFLEYLNLKRSDFIIPYQVHGTDILHISKKDIVNNNQYSKSLKNSDGVYTFDNNLVLGVTVADCAGIILYDRNTRFIAALHSGWRGTCGMPHIENDTERTDSILLNCINIYKHEYGQSSNDLRAWVSPCAKSCCYEVGKEFINYFSKYPQCIEKRKEKYYLDMSVYIRQELLEQGLHEDNIIISRECTICNNTFHSHRREQLYFNSGIKGAVKSTARSVVYVGNL